MKPLLADLRVKRLLAAAAVLILAAALLTYYFKTRPQTPENVSPAAVESDRRAQQNVGGADEIEAQKAELTRQLSELQSTLSRVEEQYEENLTRRKNLESAPRRAPRPPTPSDISDPELRSRLSGHGVALP